MPVLRVDASTRGVRLHGPGDLGMELSGALAALGPTDPVVVLIHGYKFSPDVPSHDPHAHILALSPTRHGRRAISWPRHLGFDRGRSAEGLCIAFGWPARGSIWQAWRQAQAAGAALADLLALVHARRPGRSDLVAHSLGARVALGALARAPRGSVGRLVLLAAAAFEDQAVRAMASPAGRGAEVINITSRENDLFDALLENAMRSRRAAPRSLGRGLSHPRWLDVQIDAPQVRAGLAALGFRIPAPHRRICHWSAYMRPGLLPFYTALIRNRNGLALARLRASIPPPPDRRWARLGSPGPGIFQIFRAVFRLGKRRPAVRSRPSRPPAPARRSETASPAT